MENNHPPIGSKSILRRSAVLAVALFAAASVMPSSATAWFVQEPDQIEATHTATSEWVKVRDTYSKEKSEWTLGKQLMEERIGLLDNEIEALRKGIDDMKASITEAQTTEIELNEENEALKDSAEILRDRVTQLEARLVALMQRMPPPAVMLTLALAQSIPDNPEETKLSLSVRYRNINGILTLLNKFNNDLHLESEARTLSNGQEADVSVLYFGLGQAYYATNDGKFAGIGTVGPDAWTWIPADEHAEAILQAIAIYNSDAEAAFVSLPVQIQ